MVPSLIHCGAPKAGNLNMYACIACDFRKENIYVEPGQVLIAVVLASNHIIHHIYSDFDLDDEVLLMLWNSDLPWGAKEFEFVELFSGSANASREWSVA